MMLCLTRAIISVPLGGLAAPASLCAALGDHRSDPEPLLESAGCSPGSSGCTFKGRLVTRLLRTEGQSLLQKLLCGDPAMPGPLTGCPPAVTLSPAHAVVEGGDPGLT